MFASIGMSSSPSEKWKNLLSKHAKHSRQLLDDKNHPPAACRFIKAAAFLEGFHEPALALLYEPVQTCPGRLASKQSTCRLVLLSVNLTQAGGDFVFHHL